MRRTHLPRIVSQFAGLMLLVAAVASPARSQGVSQVVIAGDLGSGGTFQTGTGTAWATGPNAPPCGGNPCDPANAVGFTIPIGGPHYALTQFRFAANWSSGTNSVTVGLYMFRGPNTAASINSATPVINPQTTNPETFTFSADAQGVAQLFTQTLNQPILLIPGNTYFLEMTESNTGTDWGWQWNNTGQNGYYAEFLPCGDVSSCWFAETVTTPAFEADGIPIATPVFVSTHQGGQILVVDGDNPGIVAVVSSGGCDPCIQPEGIVVGPDNKIYIADPTLDKIYRMDQSSANFETLPACTGSPCPLTPQAPAFSSTPSGDLYFSDPGGNSTNDIFKIAGAAAVPVGGTFSNPTVVIPAATTNTDLLGPGTAFDASNDLLFDDIKNNTVWSSPPPYSSVSSLASITNPGAIAFNKRAGQTYVVSGGQILSIAAGSGTPYYMFTSPDVPQFMQFDPTGRLFVATAQNTASPYFGKVWRVDPPVSSDSSPTATLLVDLNAFWASGDNGLGLRSDQADGVALPSTLTQTQILVPGVQTIYRFNTDDNVKITASASSMAGKSLTVTFVPTLYSAFTPPPNFPGEKCIPFGDISPTSPAAPLASDVCGLLQFDCFYMGIPNGGDCTTFQYDLLVVYDLPPNLPAIGGPDSLIVHGVPCPTFGVNAQDIFYSYSVLRIDPTTHSGGSGTGSCVETTYTPGAPLITTGTTSRFVGWGSPVSDTELNIVKAGSTRPLQFQLFDILGNPVTNLSLCKSFIVTGGVNVCLDSPTVPTPWANFTSMGIVCPSGAPIDTSTDVTVSSPGSSGLSNNGGGSYTLPWQTQKAWKGFCANVKVTFDSGLAATPAALGFELN